MPRKGIQRFQLHCRDHLCALTIILHRKTPWWCSYECLCIPIVSSAQFNSGLHYSSQERPIKILTTPSWSPSCTESPFDAYVLGIVVGAFVLLLASTWQYGCHVTGIHEVRVRPGAWLWRSVCSTSKLQQLPGVQFPLVNIVKLPNRRCIGDNINSAVVSFVERSSSSWKFKNYMETNFLVPWKMSFVEIMLL